MIRHHKENNFQCSEPEQASMSSHLVPVLFCTDKINTLRGAKHVRLYITIVKHIIRDLILAVDKIIYASVGLVYAIRCHYFSTQNEEYNELQYIPQSVN